MMGRVGVFELMAMDDVLKKAVAQDLDSIALKQLARQKGMQSMKESAVKKMLNGDTSFQEIMKVVLS
jgi:type II secretory ATPase GspE/PulE/Tfp pilus assembly ATPase PilB-like protein